MQKSVLLLAAIVAALSFGARADELTPEPDQPLAAASAVGTPSASAGTSAPAQAKSQETPVLISAEVTETAAREAAAFEQRKRETDRAVAQSMLARVDVTGANGCQGFGILGGTSAPSGQEYQVPLPVALQSDDTRVAVAGAWARAALQDGSLRVIVERNEGAAMRFAQLSIESSAMLCIVELKQPSAKVLAEAEARKEADHRNRYPLGAPETCPDGSECAKSRWFN